SSDDYGYLFAYFTGNSGNEEAIRFALSQDGYQYRALNDNHPILSSKDISSTGGVRDPHILRTTDGNGFLMVATDMVSANGWNSNRAMVLLRSADLIHWTNSIINIQKRFPGNDDLLRVWAPQTIYDQKVKKYMIYWSMKHGDGPDKIYYAYANASFTDLEAEPKQLFFSPNNTSCIDGDIVFDNGKFHLFFKTEGAGNGIKKAVSNELTKGYEIIEDRYLQQTQEAVEGSGVFKLNHSDEYILMYDLYMKGHYQFTKSSNLSDFKIIDQQVSMDFKPRHGTVISISKAEYTRLLNKWWNPSSSFTKANNRSIKRNGIVVDTINRKVYLPVGPGTVLSTFNPQFKKTTGVELMPIGPVNFSKGPVLYTLKIGSQAVQKYHVEASIDHNPILEGYYADPEIIYSKQDSKFYIYPTSDGFDGWSGNYFNTFSSTDLVNWKNEGVILDLPRDVSWGKRNAWAPSVAEKKIKGEYRYFDYFTAAQKIGVAVAKHPNGPFKDSGKPLIMKKPAGIRGGQEIDPDVFTDPETGKSFLYWGNGYMAVAPLNEDMISIDTNAIKIITPNKNFREGTEVFYRKGKYYFLWSEDDTRSENYRVAYGTSDSPLGPISITQNSLVLVKNPEKQIYGTGHNSVIQIPGKDEWYIVYHRFTRPKGITMGKAAGYNREVCIDRLSFDDTGNILKVTPTLKGIEPVKL
ncbi:MAG: beta-xylosidase, partial [Chryseobacterium sp.]